MYKELNWRSEGPWKIYHHHKKATKRDWVRDVDKNVKNFEIKVSIKISKDKADFIFHSAFNEIN